MITVEDIFLAYFDCRRNKRGTASALEFEVNYEENLLRLLDEVNNRTYKPSQSIAFIVTKPRRREIFAANFRDRVLHHLIDLKLRPLIERELVDTTCNNRLGKGTEACVMYVEEFIRECSENYTKDCWVCKMDMQGFFMSINKPLLINMITDFVNTNYSGDDMEDIKWLLKVILSDRPEQNCLLKSPMSEWEPLDKSKSLFHIDGDLGLPIGNLISQLMVNYYLNEFDHYVKEELGFKYYTRYVDDFVIVREDKDNILRAIPMMREKLKEVGVILHPKKFYLQHYSKGVDIVGSVVKPGRTYTGNRVVCNAFMAVADVNRMKATPANAAKLCFVVNSYLGFLKHRAAYNIRRKLAGIIDHKWHEYIYINDNYFKVGLQKQYRERNIIKNKLLKQRRNNGFAKNHQRKRIQNTGIEAVA